MDEFHEFISYTRIDVFQGTRGNQEGGKLVENKLINFNPSLSSNL